MLISDTINIHSLSHGIRAFKINRNQTIQINSNQSIQNQQQSECSAAPETRTKEQQPETTTQEIIIRNSKFTSQTKEKQSQPQSKTQTWLLIQYPPPQQYPDPSELTD